MKKAKKMTSLFLCICVVLTGLTGLTFIASAAALPEVDGHYVIDSAEDFAAIADTGLDKEYWVTADFAVADDQASLSTFTGSLLGKKADGTNAVITLKGNALTNQLKGKINNITLAGTVSGSGDKVGSFANQASSGAELTNCINTATVVSTNTKTTYTGGLIGYAAGATANATSIKIANSKNVGVISNQTTGSGSDIGGLIGYGYGFTISDSSNQGTVTANRAAVAGLVAYTMNNFVTIERCFNSGSVISKGNNGKAAGIASTIAINAGKAVVVKDCFNTGEIRCSSGTVSPDGGAGIVNHVKGAGTFTLENCYNAGALAPGAATAANIIRTWSTTGISTIQNNYYLENMGANHTDTVTSGLTSKTAAELADLAGLGFSTSVWEINESIGYPYPTLIANPYPFSGDAEDGSASRPYLITDQASFVEKIYKNPSKRYRLENNITLDASYVPQEFADGTLDGNNKTITVAINKTESNAGLFTKLSGTVNIQNLTITGSVTGTSKVGALAGYAEVSSSSIVKNITANATITGSSADTDGFDYVGGVLGGCFSNASAKYDVFSGLVNKGTVTNTAGTCAGVVPYIVGYSLVDCANLGTIQGQKCAGIALTLGKYTAIENCYNSGDIQGQQLSAGICADLLNYRSENITISNSYNTGAVNYSSTEQNSGGIVANVKTDKGSSLTISNCYNAGPIGGDFTRNPLTGTVGANVTINNSYYLDVAAPTADSSAKTIAQLAAVDLGSAYAMNVSGGVSGYQLPQLKTNPQKISQMIWTVSYSEPVNGTFAPGTTSYQKDGASYTFSVAANEGYRIVDVTANGTPLVASEGSTYTFPVTADTTIVANFEEALGTPEIAKTYEKAFVSSEPTEVNGTIISQPMGIVFAKIGEDIFGYELQSYGMEFSASADFTNAKQYSAVKKSTLGNYGICFYGDFPIGAAYYARPYAIYHNYIDESTITVYGTVVTFTPNAGK